jgi:chemotaxis protein CheC
MLTDLERDALTELANLGIGRAAASLSRMIGEPVQLSVPSVELLGPGEIALRMARRTPSTFIGIREDFTGNFPGRALLLFPEEKSLELVRAVVGPATSLDEVADLEQEALAEVGNVILNGFLGTVANQLKRRMDVSLPEVMRGEAETLFEVPEAGSGSDVLVLFLTVDFVVRSRGIQGYLAVLMNFASFVSLRGLVREFLGRLPGEAAT